MRSKKTGSLEENCSICLEAIENSQKVIIQLPCNHLFHKACIKEWLKKDMVCPNCKGQVKAKEEK